MPSTVVVVVITRGVIVGVIVTMVLVARSVAHLITVKASPPQPEHQGIAATGERFLPPATT